MKPVKQIQTKKGMKVTELFKEFSQSNVMAAGKLAQAADVLEKAIKDKDTKLFFGQAGALVPGGMKHCLLDFISNGWCDVFVTTGATLTHDMAEALGFRHYQGSEHADDAALHKKGLDRMWNSYMPNEVYEKMEDFFAKHYDSLKDINNIKDLLWFLGKKLNKKDSLLTVAYQKKIPIFCPALADSGIGLMLWGILAKGKPLSVLAFEDMKVIIDIAWTAKRSAVFYLGGGVPKNYIQQSMQFSPKKAVAGVQITTDRPEPGGSSGAPLKEGISWGKLNEKAEYVDVFLDSTVALPLITAELKQRLM